MRRNKLILHGLNNSSVFVSSVDVDDPKSDDCCLAIELRVVSTDAKPWTKEVVAKQLKRAYQMQRVEIFDKLDMVCKSQFVRLPRQNSNSVSMKIR